MALPAFAIYSFLYLYPSISNLWNSTKRWDGVTPPEFIGARNFTYLATNDDLFLKVVGNNFRFAFVVVVLQTSLSLLFATFLLKNTKTTIFLRVVYFFPTILSSVSVGLIWLFLYNPNYGLINATGKSIGLMNEPGINWLGDGRFALYAIAITQVWFHTGQMMVVYIAGLQQIPKELYEAAEVDGASPLRIYRSIALPLSRPAMGATAIFLFVINWNDLLWPLLLIQESDKKTLPLAMLAYRGEYFVSFSMLFTAVMVASLPMVIMYLMMQRSFIAGLTAGAVKG